MKLGAVDYLQKPFDVDALELVIRRALELSRFRLENRFLREQAGAAPRFGDLIGSSPAMRRGLRPGPPGRADPAARC